MPPSDGRPALVLLPGLLCNERLWRPQIRGLADIAEIVVADLSQGTSMADMAARVLSAVPERFALAGLSMGGYVAFEIMRRAPERVVRLALLDTSARADSPEVAARRRGLINLAQRGRFTVVSERLLPMFVHEDRLGDEALIAEIMAMNGEAGWDMFLRQQHAIRGRPDSRSDLPLIRCPTLVLCGRQDQLTPLGMSEEIAARIPGARLSVIEECGHLSTLERPGKVTAEMRAWLCGD